MDEATVLLSGPERDRMAILERIFDRITPYFLSQLISNWTKTPYKIPPDLDGRRKLDTALQTLGSLSRTKVQALRKLEKFFTFNCFWNPFLIADELDYKHDKLPKRFKTERYFPNPRISVNGFIYSLEIDPGIFLIVVDFSSRSSLLRTFCRFVLFTKLKLFLVESNPLSREILISLIQPALGLNLQNPPINSMTIRAISQNWSRILGLTFLVTTETAGVEGLETVSIAGKDVLPGSDELKTHRKMDNSILSLGPWVGIKTDSFSLNIYEGLKINRFVHDDFQRLKGIFEEED